MTFDSIPVIEFFGPTIQGEGVMCGKSTYFLRLGGCDYKCTMCDSKHAVDPEQIKKNAVYYSPKELAAKLVKETSFTEVKWLTISGGNPCMWDLGYVIEELHKNGIKVAIETQGTLWQDWLLNCDLVTISPKGPGMGEMFYATQYKNFVQKLIKPSYEELLDVAVCLKIVVFDEKDLEFAKNVYTLTDCSNLPLYLSLGNSDLPGSDISFPSHVVKLSDRYEQIAGRLYNDEVLSKAIFLPQLHVYIWGNKQGV